MSKPLFSLVDVVENTRSVKLEFDDDNVVLVEVKPIALRDVANLASNHFEAFERMFNGESIDSLILDYADFVLDLLRYGLVLDENKQAVHKLSLGHQLRILTGVMEVSNMDAEYLGNFIRLVGAKLRLLTGLECLE